MAGGEGSRLWPASTPDVCKPFIRLHAGRSLFQKTIERFAGGPDGLYSPPALICAARSLELARDQAAAAGVRLGPVVAERIGGGTTACAALGALLAAESDPNRLLLLAPSDHRIKDDVAFHAAVTAATRLAQQGRIVVFGATPAGPAPGFGYVRPGAPSGDGHALEGFVEKPDPERAVRLVSAGWLWNAGLFLASAATLLSELERCAPSALAAARSAFSTGERTDGLVRLGQADVATFEPTSFDVAVMERTQVGAVVRLDCGWSDMGTWEAVWDAAAKDGADNHASGDVRLASSSGCLVRAEGVPVRVEGMTDVVVVATAAGVLVRPRA